MIIEVIGTQIIKTEKFQATTLFAVEKQNEQFGSGKKWCGFYRKFVVDGKTQYAWKPLIIPSSLAPVGSITPGNYEIQFDLSQNITGIKRC